MSRIAMLILCASLCANVALGGVVYLGIMTRSSFIDLIRKGAKYFNLPPVGRWNPNKDYQFAKSCELNRNFFILVIGQSNGANAAFAYNHSEDSKSAAFFDGKCFTLSDPVVGGDGTRGSPWPLFADRFKAHFGRSVTVISAGWGGSTIQNWQQDGYSRFALEQIEMLKAAGGRIDAVFWQQGESDQFTPAEEYKTRFIDVVARFRAAGVDAPVFVAKATRNQAGTSEMLRQAQDQLANMPGLKAGADTDPVLDRFDGVHLGAEGVRLVSEGWLNALIACKCVK